MNLRECREIGRGIEEFMQREFMALNDEQMLAAAFAWRSESAHRTDHQSPALQREHQSALAGFVANCGGL